MSTGTETASDNGSDSQPRRKKKAAVPKSSGGKTKRAKKKKKGTKKKSKKKVAKESRQLPKSEKGKRSRMNWPFPTGTFQDALELAGAIQEHGAGQPIRRLTLFDAIKKSPESGPSRQLITDANKYGLITGGYQSDTLELSPDGKLATDDEAPARERARARVKLAIQQIAPFNAVYERYVNSKMPSRAVLIDAMKEADVPLN
jgi:hypothetical protein